MTNKKIEKESPRAQAAFDTYLTMPLDGNGSGRSLRKLREILQQNGNGKAPSLTTLENWSTSFTWVERTKAFDRDRAEARRKAHIAWYAEEAASRLKARGEDADLLRAVGREKILGQPHATGETGNTKPKKGRSGKKTLHLVGEDEQAEEQTPVFNEDPRARAEGRQNLLAAAKIEHLDYPSGSQMNEALTAAGAENGFEQQEVPPKDFLEKLLALFDPGETDARKRAEMMMETNKLQCESRDHPPRPKADEDGEPTLPAPVDHYPPALTEEERLKKEDPWTYDPRTMLEKARRGEIKIQPRVDNLVTLRRELSQMSEQDRSRLLNSLEGNESDVVMEALKSAGHDR